jgi:hypothetical protein
MNTSSSTKLTLSAAALIGCAALARCAYIKAHDGSLTPCGLFRSGLSSLLSSVYRFFASQSAVVGIIGSMQPLEMF